MKSIILNNKVLDFHYRKNSEFSYVFSVGNIFVGQVFKQDKHNWTAVGKSPSRFNGVSGFGSRYHASVFLLHLENIITTRNIYQG